MELPSFLTIHQEGVAAMRSPVGHLFAYVHKALEVLPARVREELKASGHTLSLRFVESPVFVCGFDRSSAEIVINTRALEVLWASAYVSGIYFDIAQKAGALEKSVVVDPEENPELKTAMILFSWLINAWLDPAANQAWPSHLPMPRDEEDRQSWQAYATEVTLQGVGYLLLHEIAHALLHHTPTEFSIWSIEQEKEADQQAISWLYTGDLSNEHDPTRIKRGIGVANALICQVAAAIFNGKFGGHSHPLKWQRLDQILRQIEEDPDHPLFAYVAITVPFFRAISGAIQHVDTYESFLQAFDSIIDELSRPHDDENTLAGRYLQSK